MTLTTPPQPPPPPAAVVASVPYVTTRMDRWAWYSYDWANSAYSAVAMGTFAPLLLDSLAYTYARHNAHETDPPNCKQINGTWAYPLNSTGCIRCIPGLGDQLFFTSDKYENPPTLYVAAGLQASAFALVIIAISVLCQAICFVSLGAMADYSSLRKQLVLVTAWMGAGIGILFLTIPTDEKGSGITGAAALGIVTSVLLAVSIIFYNAFIPHVVACEPKVVAAEGNVSSSEQSIVLLKDQIKNQLSLIGVAWGYAASIIVLAASAGLLFAAGAFDNGATEANAQRGYIYGCAFPAAWWGVFTFLIIPLHPWPGKQLPKGKTSYVAEGWRSTVSTLKEARKLHHTFRYLISYFMFISGINTTAAVGLIFAKRDMCATVIDQFIVSFEVPIAAFAGCFVFFKIQKCGSVSSVQMLRLTLAVYLILPLWGIIGYTNTVFGFRQIWELYTVGIIFGFILGANQSYARTVFADLIPSGMESQFFSLYAITDKCSSWIGPLVIGMLTQTGIGGVMRVGFFYLFVVCAVPIWFLRYVDVEEGKAQAILLFGAPTPSLPDPVSIRTPIYSVPEGTFSDEMRIPEPQSQPYEVLSIPDGGP